MNKYARVSTPSTQPTPQANGLSNQLSELSVSTDFSRNSNPGHPLSVLLLGMSSSDHHRLPTHLKSFLDIPRRLLTFSRLPRVRYRTKRTFCHAKTLSRASERINVCFLRQVCSLGVHRRTQFKHYINSAPGYIFSNMSLDSNFDTVESLIFPRKVSLRYHSVLGYQSFVPLWSLGCPWSIATVTTLLPCR